MKAASDWTSRRWIEFRQGYSVYIMFILGFSNFVLIAYNFVPVVQDIMPLWAFVPSVLAVLVPVSLVLGRMHHRHNYPQESDILARNNFYRDKVIPDSKEVYEARFREDMARFMEWQAAMALRRFNRSEPDATDQADALRWMDTMKHWAEKHRQYQEGASASKLH